MFNNNLFAYGFSLTSIIAIVVWFYAPGLSGGFMLDDWSTLPALFDSIDSCGFSCGIMSGDAGPTGRPLSLFSFALQSESWPHNPYPFKLVNLLIHAVNAILVFYIYRQLITLLKIEESKPVLFAAITSILWALWPLQVSSVLYVVQRMVLLNSTFVLIGIVSYLYLRPKVSIDGNKQFFQFLGLATLLGAMGVFGVFAKESAVLLVVFLLVLEIALFSNNENVVNRNVLLFRSCVLYIPVVMLIAYILIHTLTQIEWLYLAREYSLYERLLTQGRILVEYIGALVFPRPSELGLYHDAYIKSTSIVAPISTLLSWFLIGGVLVGSWLFRQKQPVLFLAVFFFFGGHLLESTILPLELYFEHRNYLPVLGITFALMFAVKSIANKASGNFVRATFYGVAILYLVVIIAVGRAQTLLWGDPVEYGVVQAKEHSESIRARSLLIDVYSRLGRVDLAYEESLLMKKDFPRIAGVIIGDVEFACYDKIYPLEDLGSVVEKLENAKFGFGAMATISRTLIDKTSGGCNAVPVNYILEVTRALKRNPLFKRKYHLLDGYEVAALTLESRYEEAVELFSRMKLLPEHWPRYVSLLATLGKFDQARDVIEKGMERLENYPQYEIYYRDLVQLKIAIEDSQR